MTYRSLLLSYFNIDTILYQGVLLSTVIVEPSHVVTLTHSTIQNDETALDRASFNGHHKVVELLLGARANPDLQDKVRTGQNHCLTAGFHPLYLFCMIVLVVHYELVLNMVHTLTVSLLLKIKQYVLAASCSYQLYSYDSRYMYVFICIHVLNMLVQYLS